MTYARVHVGPLAGQRAQGDALSYTVEIRGATEAAWKPLKKDVRESTARGTHRLPDGEYASADRLDSPDNPPADALAGQLESDPFYIDNSPPRLTNLAAARNGNRLEVSWHAGDALNNLKKAEYSLDGGEWTVVSPVGGLSDSLELDYRLAIDNAAPGEHTVAVRVQDAYDNQAVEKVVVK
jgi:hypothetical protein